MDQLHLPVLLRKLNKEIHIEEFVRAKLSPERSLIALQTRHQTILLYELGSTERDGEFLKEFQVKKSNQFFWTICQQRRIFLLTQTAANALVIHQFLICDKLGFLSFKEGIKVISGGDSNEGKNNENPSSNVLQPLLPNLDCNTIVRYKISLLKIQNKINSLCTEKSQGQENGTIGSKVVLIETFCMR